MQKKSYIWTTILCCLVLLSCTSPKSNNAGTKTEGTKTEVTKTDPSSNLEHPLDPLSATEMNEAVSILKNASWINETCRFPTIDLDEPSKESVLQFRPGNPFKRNALIVVYDYGKNKTFEARINLTNKRLTSYKEVTGVQPRMMHTDGQLVRKILLANPRYRRALDLRGIPNYKEVEIDCLPAGRFGLPNEDKDRVVRVVSYHKAGKLNGYARPIEGLIAFVDLTTQKMFNLIDKKTAPIPEGGEFEASTVATRQPLKPLKIEQPGGTSFQVKGQQVTWDNWRFRFSVHHREGLVLHMVEYLDKVIYRPILYRASVSEMIVPYGDPSETWFFRNIFDVGDFGLSASALDPNDYPANAATFPATFGNDTGRAHVVHRAVAIYERDGGVLWRHADGALKRKESRRGRELVVSTITTVGNYDYVLNWVFRQDGTLEQETHMTGIMLTKAVERTTDLQHSHAQSFGHLVAPHVEAVHHQHFICFRLDFDVDGQENIFVETNTESMPKGKDNPQGNGFTMKESTLATEQQAQRDLNILSSRRWKIVNPSKRNRLGQSIGFLLASGENTVPFAAADSSERKRAGFINHHIWCTQYAPDEIFAAGFYPNRVKEFDGLPKWTKANRSLQNKDLVVWYTLGITHIPRPEEFPIMPNYKVGFRLMPNSFFDKNPALDVAK